MRQYFYIVLILIVIFQFGCIGESFDKKGPEIILENIIKDGDRYIIKYNINRVILRGRVRDELFVEYLKINGENVKLTLGKFEYEIKDFTKDLILEAADGSENSTREVIFLEKDEKLPIIKSIVISGLNYVKGVVLNGNPIEFLVEVSDESGIDKVLIDNQVCELENEDDNEKYIATIEIDPLSKKDIIVLVYDVAGNVLEYPLDIYYDIYGPEIREITVDGYNYSEEFYYGANINPEIEFEIYDKSEGVNTIDVEGFGNVTTFSPNLVLGENSYRVVTTDIYGNEAIKEIVINYVEDMPIIENLRVANGGDVREIYNNNYYINRSDITVSGEVYSGNTEHGILSIEADGVIKNQNILSSRESFLYEFNVAEDSNRTISLDVKNDAYISLEREIRLVYDKEPPVITVTNEEDIYVNVNSGIIDDINSLEITDNIAVREILLLFNGESVGSSEELNFLDENFITVEACDYAGNSSSETFNVLKDIDVPLITSVEIAGNSQGISYENSIVVVFGEGETSKILSITAEDSKSGIREIRLDGVVVESSDIEITNDSILEIEDNAGNILSKTVDVIRVLDVELLSGKIVGGRIGNIHYISSSECVAEIESDDDCNIWSLEKVERAYSTENKVEVAGLLSGDNSEVFIVENNLGDSSTFEIKINYDTVLPTITNISLNGMEYSKGMSIEFKVATNLDIIVLDNVEIYSVMVDGVSLVLNEDGEYNYSYSTILGELNQIEITLQDIAGNIYSEILEFYTYDIGDVELFSNESSVNSIDIKWNSQDIPIHSYTVMYRVLGSVDYLSIEGVNGGAYTVTGLKDNLTYEIKVILNSNGVAVRESNIVKAFTLNEKPQKLEGVKLGTTVVGGVPIMNLSWNIVGDIDYHDFMRYVVSRSLDGINFEERETITDISTLMYTDTLIESNENKKYTYRVELLDKGGLLSDYDKVEEYSYNLSPDLSTISITSGGVNINSVSTYGVKSATKNRVDLNIEFTDLSGTIDIESYTLYRTLKNNNSSSSDIVVAKIGVNNGSITILDKSDTVLAITIAGGVITVEDSGYDEKSAYTFKLIAKDKDYDVLLIDDLDMSSEISTGTVNTIDLIPLHVSIGANMILADDGFEISWTKAEDEIIGDFARYELYRDGVLIKTETDINKTTILDENLDFVANPSYTYIIRVYDTNSNSVETEFDVDQNGVVTNIINR